MVGHFCCIPILTYPIRAISQAESPAPGTDSKGLTRKGRGNMKLVRLPLKGRSIPASWKGHGDEVQLPAGTGLTIPLHRPGGALTWRGHAESTVRASRVCVGLNHRCHAEVKLSCPQADPVFEASTAVIGPEEPIIYPAVSRRRLRVGAGVVIGAGLRGCARRRRCNRCSAIHCQRRHRPRQAAEGGAVDLCQGFR